TSAEGSLRQPFLSAAMCVEHGWSRLRVQQIEDASQRNACPLGPVVQFVIQLVQGLLEKEQSEQRVAIGFDRRNEQPVRHRLEIRAQECGRRTQLPNSCPRLQPMEF